ncbi:hypothetical protein ILFOPFJJ_06999 [Ensifer psoraleae]|nr:hypothetical protein [Sinorhizobium psoraleae]
MLPRGVADPPRLHQCGVFGIRNGENMALALHRLGAGLRFSEMNECGTNAPITIGVLPVALDISVQRVAAEPPSNALLVVLTQVVTEAPKCS